ncbi:hypothetical protein TcasGA2_TC004810 [Tribolium castaneum]|uniref:Uncharacterized protein n=1 Tax=Tribolium castaneum TaxID=7070 RepID=D6WBG2_TRICA|nr:hypothetical protein TcasGA2_TC004810 [Tribolium castaneum]
MGDLKYLDSIGSSDIALYCSLQFNVKHFRKISPHTKSVINFESLNEQLSKIEWALVLCSFLVMDNWNLFKAILHNATINRGLTKILQLIRQKRRLWRTFKRTNSNCDYVVHRDFSNKFKDLINKAKLTYEKRVADSKDPKRFFKHIRNKLTDPVAVPNELVNLNDDLDLEEAIRRQFDNDYFDIRIKYDEIFNSKQPLIHQANSGNVINNAPIKEHVKLPPMKLFIFNGDLKSWRTFINKRHISLATN